MRILINHDNEYLYCWDCKENIPIGQKYVEVKELYRSSFVNAKYCLECCPTEEDYEEPYICE